MSVSPGAEWRRLGGVEEAILKVIGDHYGVPARSLSRDTELTRDLGADYIDTREVIMTLEELFDVYFDVAPGAESIRTVGDVIDLVRRGVFPHDLNGADEGREGTRQ